MKKIILILFLCCYNTGFSQKIQYIPIFIDQCTGERDTSISYGINEDDVFDCDGKPIELDKKGEYILYTMPFFIDVDSILINIEDTGIVRDTFNIMKIQPNSHMLFNPPLTIYYSCEGKAEGYIEDYYYNGTLRCCGEFKDGLPVDTLKEYYRSGRIKEMSIPWYGARSFPVQFSRILDYSENGILTSDYNWGAGYIKEFFINGNLKYIDDWDEEHNFKCIHYYENGNLKSVNKNDQYAEYAEYAEYDSTGRAVQKVVRKEADYKSTNLNSWDKECDVLWTIYNKSGEESVLLKYRKMEFSPYLFTKGMKGIQDILPEEFREVILYKDNHAINRIEFEYYYENGEQFWNYVLSRQTNNNWEVVKRDKIDNVYDIILGHMMQAGIKIENGR